MKRDRLYLAHKQLEDVKPTRILQHGGKDQAACGQKDEVNQFSSKETGHHLQGYSYILSFIRSGANLAQTFTKVTFGQREKKIQIFLHCTLILALTLTVYRIC